MSRPARGAMACDSSLSRYNAELVRMVPLARGAKMSGDKHKSLDQPRSPSLGNNGLPVPAADASLTHIGKYVVLERISSGGMGIIYKCSQPELDRPVAVKVLTAGRHASPQQIARFQREARAAAKLTHPNVVQIYDVGTDGDLNYFVMEYVDGWSL